MNSSILFTVGLFLSSISTTTCLIPDDYTLTITVKTNDTYIVEYKGDVLFAPAVNAKVNGNYDEYKDKEVEKIISEFETVEGLKEVQYLGEGRFYVDLKTTKDMGENYYFISEDLGFFQVWSVFDELRIEGIELSSEVKSELKSVDINMEGKLTVRCQSGIKVRNHNAKSKEDKKNSVNYKWDLNLDTSIPDIRIEFKNNSQEPPDEFVSSDNAVQIEGYQINYIGNKDNGDGTSTWNYTIDVTDNAMESLDHWVLALDADHIVLSACEDYSGYPGIDKTSNIYGISFYEWYDEGDVLKNYYFTLDGQFEVGLLPVALKAGNKFGKTVINGPTGKAPGNNNDDVYADNENSVLIDGFRFIYNGYTNNSDGTSTWNYSVRSTNASASHFSGFVLGLGPRLKINSGGVGYRGIYTDQNTGLYGAVFYEKINKNDDNEDFYFVLNNQYELGEIDFSYINAREEIKKGKIKGPSEIPLEPEEWSSEYKTYFVGDFVLYKKSGYICIKSHTTSPYGKVEPNISQDLWEKVYGDDEDEVELSGDTEIDGYVFYYLGYENNSDGSSTWYYKVSSTGSAKNDLTEWVLGLNEEHEVLDGEGFNKVEKHIHSGVYGAVFDEKVKKNNDSEEYSVTLNHQYEPGNVEIGLKAGSFKGTGFLTGPSEDRIDFNDTEDNDDYGTDFLSMVKFFDDKITEYYEEKGYFPRTWGDYAYTDLGLAPEDYKDVYYDRFEFVPRGSILNLGLEDGFTITVTTTSGASVTFPSIFNWILIYDTITNYWYYHSVDPDKMIDIHSLKVTETN